jgi:copper chaperone CopZ
MKYLAIFSLAVLFSLPAFAQNQSIDTATVEVDGVCEMCKERIENAAYIKGVKKATWDKENKTLTVIYQPKKVTVLQIEESVAKAGHDTQDVKADDKAYARVHACCKYRDTDTH